MWAVVTGTAKSRPGQALALEVVMETWLLVMGDSFFFFIVIQLQLCAFSPHPSTPPQPNPPPSPTSTLPLDLVHVSFKIVPVVMGDSEQGSISP